jgi:hypothetical protein
MAATAPEPAKTPWDARLIERMSRSSASARHVWSPGGLAVYGTVWVILATVTGYVGWYLVGVFAYAMAALRLRQSRGGT